MSFVYKKPPLQEMLCGLSFEPGENSDSTLPGRLFEKIKEMLPVRRESNGDETDDGVFISFQSEDGHRVLRLYKDKFTFHRLIRYEGWDNYLSDLSQVLDCYYDVATPKSIFGPGLVYVNQIAIPVDVDANVSQYIRAYPTFPSSLLKKGNVVRFSQNMNIKYDIGHLSLTTGSMVNKSTKEPGFMVQIDFHAPASSHFSHEACMSWLSDAHTIIEEVFLECITPQAEALFGGKIDV